MRFIDKSERCPEFDNYIAKNKPAVWDNFKKSIKLKLNQHLWREQKTICIYCQQQLPYKEKEIDHEEEISFSHIEHIRPKSKYKHLTFDYNNLSVSCQGFDCKKADNKREFCGHRKDRPDSEYDENKFLNPIELPDIESYFEYDMLGNIHPTSKDNKKAKKAQYMITILDLNHKILIDMREYVYLSSIEDKDVFLPENEILPPFYSMLKQLVPEKYSG